MVAVFVDGLVGFGGRVGVRVGGRFGGRFGFSSSGSGNRGRVGGCVSGFGGVLLTIDVGLKIMLRIGLMFDALAMFLCFTVFMIVAVVVISIQR